MGKARALVTVGMPVYNGQRWLAAAIESILSQTFSDLQLLISDNASTDDTQGICESYAERDSRVRYSRNKRNIGLFRNFNHVFGLSDTKYFKWASCNDICDERFLESCIAVLEARPDVVLAYPQTALFDEELDAARPYDGRLNLEQNSASERVDSLLSNLKLNNMFNGVIRSDALRRTALNQVYTGSDINLMAELAMHGKLVEVPEVLFFRRMNAAASSILVPESERSRYFAHEQRDVIELRLWRMQMGFFGALRRAPLTPKERFRISNNLLRRLVHNRGKLLHELKSPKAEPEKKEDKPAAVAPDDDGELATALRGRLSTGTSTKRAS